MPQAAVDPGPEPGSSPHPGRPGRADRVARQPGDGRRPERGAREPEKDRLLPNRRAVHHRRRRNAGHGDRPAQRRRRRATGSSSSPRAISATGWGRSATASGSPHDVVRSPMGKGGAGRRAGRELARRKAYAVVSVTHVDTSTGACAPDQGICRSFCKAPGSSISSTASAPRAASRSGWTIGGSTSSSPPPRNASAPRPAWPSTFSRSGPWPSGAACRPSRPIIRTSSAGCRS